MRTLPTVMIRVLSSFVPLFSRRVWRPHVQVLLIGVILAPGKRTVSSALHAMGLSQEEEGALPSLPSGAQRSASCSSLGLAFPLSSGSFRALCCQAGQATQEDNRMGLGQLLLLVRRWYPQREIVAVADHAYASLKLLDRCRNLRSGQWPSSPVLGWTRRPLAASRLLRVVAARE
jgi:hypothetical protein